MSVDNATPEPLQKEGFGIGIALVMLFLAQLYICYISTEVAAEAFDDVMKGLDTGG